MEDKDGATEVHEGGCLCGKVRYKVTGQPRYQANCHCSFCKMVTGSAYLVETVFAKRDVQFAGTLKTFEMPSPAHGRLMRVQFCPGCGTTLGMTFERFPDVQAICSGTYDDPNWFPVVRHIFTDSAMNDVAFPPDVEIFERHSLRTDGTFETALPKSIRARTIQEIRQQMSQQAPEARVK